MNKGDKQRTNNNYAKGEDRAHLCSACAQLKNAVGYGTRNVVVVILAAPAAPAASTATVAAAVAAVAAAAAAVTAAAAAANRAVAITSLPFAQPRRAERRRGQELRGDLPPRH